MSNKALTVLFLLLWMGAYGVDHRWGSPAKKSARDYPKPEYVQYPKLSDEQLMYLSRHIARQTESRSGSLGLIEPGKKGFILVKENQDPRIMKAVVRALKERGADADWMKTSDLLEKYGHPKAWSKDDNHDPVKEPDAQFAVRMTEYRYNQSHFSPAAWALMPEVANDIELRVKKLHTKNEILKKFMDSHPEYCCAFVEWMGSDFRTRELLELLGNKYQSSWRFENMNRLVEDGQIPGEVWRTVEQKVMEVIPWIRHVHVTDPEGTDLEYSVNAEEANYWMMGAYGPDYMRMYPQQATHAVNLVIGKDVQVVPDSHGVLGGTRGHFFATIPHMTLTIEHGVVAKVEGGGLQGRMLDDLRNQYKDLQIPYFRFPGWAHLYHMEMPVNPKDGSREVAWGFGVETTIKEALDFEIKHNIPLYHDWHFENYFPTFEIALSTGKNMKLIDKGYLTVLDDPEIRAIASKYGDPADILKPEGAAPLPGVNAPGDYWKEYAPNPQAYWLKERELVAAGKSPFIVRMLPRKLQEIGETQEAENKPGSRPGISNITSFFGLN